MKFLMMLAILISSSAFAQPEPPENRRAILCYEQARQGGHAPLAYFLEERGLGMQVLHVTYPYEYFEQPLKLDPSDNCLKHPGEIPGGDPIVPPRRLQLCPGEGQRLNGLRPVEASNNVFHTVYCDKRINAWFFGGDN